MDRRTALKLIPAALITSSCVPGSKASAEVAHLLTKDNLAILDMFGRAVAGSIVVGGLGERGFPPITGVAPNGRALAMLVRSRASESPSTEFVVRKMGESEHRAISPFPAAGIAMSSSSRIFITPTDGQRARLREVRGYSGKLEVSDHLMDIDFSEGYGRLRISDDGNRMAFGTRERWMVIDVASKRILREGDGNSPSLSPDGQWLAHRTPGNDLAVGQIGGTLKTYSFSLRSVRGVGAWSPNGKWLLVGTGRFPLFGQELNAFHAETGELVRLWSIGDDWGDRSFWVDRSLLDPA